MAIIKCPHCGATTSTVVPTCANCGNITASASPVASVRKASAPKSPIVNIVIAAVLVIAIGLGIFAYVNNTLWGDDKIAFDLIVNSAYHFRDPSSIELLGGSLGVDKDCMWCRIRARSTYSWISTEDYFIMDDGGIIITTNHDYASATDEFNVEKVRRMLHQHFN